MAVMEFVPAASVEVLYVARPLESVTGDPKFAPPLWNCIVPVAADGDTVAVNVTEEPYVEGFNDDVTATVVDVPLTTCVTMFEVPAEQKPSGYGVTVAYR